MQVPDVLAMVNMNDHLECSTIVCNSCNDQLAHSQKMAMNGPAYDAKSAHCFETAITILYSFMAAQSPLEVTSEKVLSSVA